MQEGKAGAVLPEPGEDAHKFIEDFGVYFAQGGSTRMYGRVLALLLIATEPGLSTSQLRESLGASKGAISSATRVLEQIGFVERFHVRGSRETFFRVKPGVWSDMIVSKSHYLTRVKEMAEEALNIKELTPEAVDKLEELRDVHAFFANAFMGLVERWEEEKGRDRK